MAVIDSQGFQLLKVAANIGQIVALDRSGLEAGMVETTDNATSAGMRTYQWSGLTEPGTVSGTLLYDPDTAVHTDMEADLKAGTAAVYHIVYPDAAVVADDAFTATPTKFDITGSVGERVEATFELKISGAITRT
jgi:hypothetical protein